MPGEQVRVEPGLVHGNPSLEDVGDDPDGPDVDDALHAGLDGDYLVLSKGHVLRVHWA